MKQKANSTLRASRAVPHPSTDRAFHRLTSEFRWDRVYSMKYGRWQPLFQNLKLQAENDSQTLKYDGLELIVPSKSYVKTCTFA